MSCINRSKTFWMAMILSLVGWPLMTCLSIPTFAQDTSQVSGVVYDQMGKPYANVSLTLTNVKTKTNLSATTDERGRYSFMDLPGGMYNVNLKVKDKVVYQGGLMVTAGTTSVVDLNLQELLVTDKATLAAIAKKHKAEEDAYKAFYDARAGDPANQVRLGEDFISKFPDSHYLGTVYSQLMNAYMSVNQQDKMFAAGEKAIELNPDDVDALSLLAMALPRRPGSDPAAAAKQY